MRRNRKAGSARLTNGRPVRAWVRRAAPYPRRHPIYKRKSLDGTMSTLKTPASPRPPKPRRESHEYIEYEKYIDGQVQRTRKNVKLVDLASAMVVLVVALLGFFLTAAVLEHWILPGGL